MYCLASQFVGVTPNKASFRDFFPDFYRPDALPVTNEKLQSMKGQKYISKSHNGIITE